MIMPGRLGGVLCVRLTLFFLVSIILSGYGAESAHVVKLINKTHMGGCCQKIEITAFYGFSFPGGIICTSEHVLRKNYSINDGESCLIPYIIEPRGGEMFCFRLDVFVTNPWFPLNKSEFKDIIFFQLLGDKEHPSEVFDMRHCVDGKGDILVFSGADRILTCRRR